MRRQSNEVAHVLAGEATLYILASHVVYFSIPECIESLIINEMIQVNFFKERKKDKPLKKL